MNLGNFKNINCTFLNHFIYMCFRLFYLMYICILPAHNYVQHVCDWCLQSREKSTIVSETEVPDDCETSYGCSELNLDIHKSNKALEPLSHISSFLGHFYAMCTYKLEGRRLRITQNTCYVACTVVII